MNLRLLYQELVKPLPGCRSLDYDVAPESTGHGCDRTLCPLDRFFTQTKIC
jgi:hypothetical protein